MIDKLLQDDAELKSYRELGPIDRLRELAQADREGRCVMMDNSTVADLRRRSQLGW